MIIRKQFKFEMAHIVRNAWSQRCSKNIHGHSYLVEFLFKGSDLDKGQMLVDFGIVKKYLNDFVDSFDHSLCLWEGTESAEIINFMQTHFERVIIMPVNSSAEMQAKIFYDFADTLIKYLKNQFPEYVNESVELHSVRIHETTTGWAEANNEDKLNLVSSKDIEFSEPIKNDWQTKFIKEFYLNGAKLKNAN